MLSKILFISVRFLKICISKISLRHCLFLPPLNNNIDKKKEKNENTQILKELSKPLQYEQCHKMFTTKFNLKRHNLTHMKNYFDTMYDDSIKKKNLSLGH